MKKKITVAVLMAASAASAFAQAEGAAAPAATGWAGSIKYLAAALAVRTRRLRSWRSLSQAAAHARNQRGCTRSRVTPRGSAPFMTPFRWMIFTYVSREFSG